MARILVIPDLHCPWDHPKARDFLCRMQERFKTDRVVCLGDEVDFHAFSLKWQPNPDLHSPSRELELAKESLCRYYKDFPHVDVLSSNHQSRIFKANYASGLPKMVLRRYEEIVGFPKGWKMIGDHLIIDNVLYIHGEGITSGSWANAHQRLKSSVVFGHLHSRAGVMYSETKRNRMFAMNTGCLIFPTAEAFSYGQHSIEKPVLGAGLVIDGQQALFVRMSDNGKLLL